MEHAKDVVGGIPYVKEAIIFLMATVAIVPLFHHLRASPVLGYLFVGALIGPFGLQIVAHAEGVHVIAELGVVFLLFAIGLELSLTRLRAMRRILFGLGGLQVLVSGAVIGGVAYLWGVSERAAIVIGVALALSSTAVVVQLLVERGAFALPVGRTSFAILLLQDLAVVPLLALIGALGGAATESIYPTLGAVGLKTIFVILLIFLIGGWAMRFLFPFIANTRNPELLTALALLAILGAASLTRAAGLSMGLGAFLIGLLLAESEFRHQVASDTFSFRGLFLGMFFISIGMSLDFFSLQDFWVELIIGVAGLVILKAAILYALCRCFQVPAPDAVRACLLLATGGEFALVAVSASLEVALFSEYVGQLIFSIAVVSMILTPLLAQLGDSLATRMEKAPLEARPESADGDTRRLENHVVLAGYGRVGRAVAQLLQEQNVPFVALDMDISRVRMCADAGEPVYYGDASRAEILRRVGIERASLVLVTIDEPRTSLRTISTIVRVWPKILIHARAHDSDHGEELLAMGASHVVLDTVETTVSLAGYVLRDLGAPMDSIGLMLESMRDRYRLPGEEAEGDDKPAS